MLQLQASGFRLTLDAENYKSVEIEIGKASRWYDRSPYFLRSLEARDAMQALIDEYRDELAQIEVEKGRWLDPALLERFLVSETPLPMRPQADDFPDVPKIY